MTAALANLCRRVLVVDDHDHCRELFAVLAAAAGCVVREARTGGEALAAAVQFLPDVVLLDIGLPDMSGYAVARALRSDPACADVFIAALTGHGMSSDRQQAAGVGIDMFLVKPVGWSTLHAALSGVRSGKSTALA